MAFKQYTHTKCYIKGYGTGDEHYCVITTVHEIFMELDSDETFSYSDRDSDENNLDFIIAGQIS